MEGRITVCYIYATRYRRRTFPGRENGFVCMQVFSFRCGVCAYTYWKVALRCVMCTCVWMRRGED